MGSRSIFCLTMQVTLTTVILLLSTTTLSSANVFTESAIFERLCHFKNDGVVNHLNSVDEAMIADGGCRMVRSQLDGYALWQDPETTAQVIAAHEVLEDICPMEAAVNINEEYSCRGGGHDLEVMAGAMHNWQRALCAPMIDPEWEGEFDPAYQPQQVALTAGFMCIIACDCNNGMLPAESLANIATDPEITSVIQKLVCSAVPWEFVDFAEASSDVEILAELSAPLMEV